MIIRGYAGRPPMEAPDLGEVLDARRTATHPFTRAVVEKAWRGRRGELRLRVMWLEDNPAAKAVKHTTGWLKIPQTLNKTPLVRRIDVE